MICDLMHCGIYGSYVGHQADAQRKLRQLNMLVELEKKLATLERLEDLAASVPKSVVTPVPGPQK